MTRCLRQTISSRRGGFGFTCGQTARWLLLAVVLVASLLLPAVAVAGEGGHYLDWSPRVVADSSGATLPQGTAMPCSGCHGAHGLPSDTLKMLKDPVTGTIPITQVRVLCECCHRPSDSTESTPTVYGLELNKLGSGVADHADASERPCSDCHGESPHAPESHGGGDCASSECHGGSGSHAVHLSASDPRGFGGTGCETCHDPADYPAFASGADSDASGAVELDETDVCDGCHSPGGDYNGVVSTGDSVGAKNNWSTRVYETTSTLQVGKERWCVGCHDGAPSVITTEPAISVSAPSVAGSETASTPYGTGYGYYVTGHGLADGLYPASQAPAASVECASCHDFERGTHIDFQPRTYSSASSNYQDGYRLRSVSGASPMEVPRLEWSSLASAFRLCFQCHDSDVYLNASNKTTNFLDSTESTATGGMNSHARHLAAGGGWSNRWDSDWDGTGDSQVSCTACHNVHGSSTPAMARTGVLTGNGLGLNLRYTPTSPDPYPTRPDSTGGLLDLPPGGGTIASNGVCSMCHSQAIGYTRAPSDFYAPRFLYAYGNVASNKLAAVFTEGVYTTPGSGALLTGDFAFTDTDNGRTVSSVNHSAGACFAQVQLSSTLDSSQDIGVDTLAAATATSIYDSAGQPMGTTPVILRLDSTAPGIGSRTPANGATCVARNADLTFALSDAEAGVDWSTFEITLTGDKGYSKTYTDLSTSVVSKTGSRLSYIVTVDPDALYTLGEVITVTVHVDDLVGNSLSAPTWQFTVSATPTVETIYIYPSGLDSNPGGYWTVPGADQWATYMDTNDGDTTYATSNTGGAGARLYIAMDDPVLGSATINSVKLHVIARYVNGWSPEPPAYAGSIRIGYKTGDDTQWSGDLALDATGLYNSACSATYTFDSGGHGLTLSDLNDLRIAVERRTGGSYPLRITQMYAEVKYTP